MLKEFKKAFTLAEVLIVIGIIGVVAALTLPNLNHATGDKEKVTKVKKIYNNLTEAFDRAQAIYGDYDTWFKDLKNQYGYIDSSSMATGNERFAKRVTEFMKISKDCGFDEGCFSTTARVDYTGEILFDNLLPDWLTTDYMIILSDGVSLAFNDNEISVDIDGPNKGKNQDGSDLFFFTAGRTNHSMQSILLMPDYDIQSMIEGYGTDFSDCPYETAWVIENGNLDYLKCPDELNWETKTSCE